MYNNLLSLFYVVKKSELKKFLSMSLLIFCILFNYSFIYSIKDGLIVPNLGAQAASFIELWIILPAVFIFAMGYLKLSTLITNKEKLFYIICCFFLTFFLIFAFFLYPNLESIKPNQIFIAKLIEKLPYLKWFIIIYNNWPLVLFNIFSELWINTLLSLLFWQYANSITPSDQAKRFYPVFALMGNFSLIGSGILLKQICTNSKAINTIQYITILIVTVGVISMLLFKYLHIISEKEIISLVTNKHKDKHHLSFKESLKLVFCSEYLWFIAIAVIAYGITINLSQGLWKAQIIKLYPSPEEYVLFMADYQKWVGMASIVMMLITSIMVRKLSWLASAITTPIIMFITGSIFFSWISFNKLIILFLPEHSYLMLAIFIGAIHIVFAKSAKFSLFDTTKELAYISLEENLRDKGKAAVDLLGERVGKSAGALLQSVLFIIIPNATYDDFAPLFLLVSICIWFIWLITIKSLNKKYLDYNICSHNNLD